MQLTQRIEVYEFPGSLRGRKKLLTALKEEGFAVSDPQRSSTGAEEYEIYDRNALLGKIMFPNPALSRTNELTLAGPTLNIRLKAFVRRYACG